MCRGALELSKCASSMCLTPTENRIACSARLVTATH